MSKVIKCILSFNKTNSMTIELPIRSEVLSVYCRDLFDPTIYIYIRVTEEKFCVERTFYYFSTNDELPNTKCLVFIGTVHCNALEYHVFEHVKPNVGRME